MERVVELSPGQVVYRRSKSPDSLGAMKKRGRFVWFALTRDYGVNSYGAILASYTVRKPILLLNIGTVEMRRAISTVYGIPFANLSCNEQYSGGGANAQFHNAIKPVLKSLKVHGTFISDDSSNTNCEGPTEIVLFANQLHRLVRTPIKIAAGRLRVSGIKQR